MLGVHLIDEESSASPADLTDKMDLHLVPPLNSCNTSEMGKRWKFHWPIDPFWLFYLQELGWSESILEQILNESSTEIVGEFLNFQLIFSIYLISRLVLFKIDCALTIKDSLLIKSCISFAPTTGKTQQWEGFTGTQQAPSFLHPCSWQVTIVHRVASFFPFFFFFSHFFLFNSSY